MDRRSVSSLIEVLAYRAAVQRDETCYTFLDRGEHEGDRLTYGELDRRSRAVAAMLHRTFSRGERALLLYPPGLEFIVAFLGCMLAGIVAVPTNLPSLARPSRSLLRLSAVADEAGIGVVLCPESTRERLSKLLHDMPAFRCIPIVATDRRGTEASDFCQSPKLDPDTVAFLQYTSGSTASPKGVMISHGNIIHNLSYIGDRANNDDRAVGISWLPAYHDMGLFAGFLFPLFEGHPSYVMAPVSFLQKPIRWLRAISRYRGTYSGGPNFAYELCERQTTPEERKSLDLDSWRVAYNGAEPIRDETLDQFGRAFQGCGFRTKAFQTLYGLAESTVLVSSGCFGDKSGPVESETSSTSQPETQTTKSRPARTEQLVSCGRPGFGTEVVIADPNRMTRVREGEVGEIWVSGPSVALGYWNLPEATARTFHAYLADSRQGPYLRTGDLGFLRAGELYVTGRIKDLIIVRGCKHYPQDIEVTIERCHPAVHTHGCAAFAVPSRAGERLSIVAEVDRLQSQNSTDSGNGSSQRREDSKFDEVIHAIRQAVAEQHEVQVHEIALVLRGTVPKTSSGKIQRHASRDASISGTLRYLARWSLEVETSRALHPQIKEIACP